MNSKTLVPTYFLCAFALSACMGGPQEPEADPVGTTQQGLPKGSGGVNGDDDYCITGVVCLAGEGDCDYDGHCVAGTYCANDIGAQFGFDATDDMCVDDTCLDGFRNGNETDVDCGPGCVPCTIQNGDPAFCTTASPCQTEQGDCDYDGHCVAGTECFFDLGDLFGFSPTTDMCLDTTCNDGMLNGNETDVDCGPGCVPCTGTSFSAEAIGGTGDERVGKVVVDSGGNRIFAGSFRGTTDLGTGSIAAFGSTSRRDVYVVKRRLDGSTIWARRFGGTVSDGDGAVSVAELNGFVVVVGNFHGTADFGAGATGFSRTSNGNSSDVFVVTLNGDGDVQWVQTFGGTGYDIAYDVAIDAGGGIQVVGAFHDSITFGSSTYASFGDFDAFIVRLSIADGSVQRSQRLGGTGRDRIFAVDTAPNRDVTIGGSFTATCTFDRFTRQAVKDQDAFVARVNPYTLRVSWLQTYGGQREDAVYGIAVDSSNRVYASGTFMRDVDFGGGSRNAADVDTVVLALDASGNYRWDAVLDNAQGPHIGIDRTSNTIGVTGLIVGSNGLLTGSVGGGRDSFLAIYNSSGAFQQGFRDGGASDDEGEAVALSNGITTVLGYFNDTGDFAGGTLTSAGQRDLFFYERSY